MQCLRVEEPALYVKRLCIAFQSPSDELQQHAEPAARKSVSGEACIYICGLMETRNTTTLAPFDFIRAWFLGH